jgi:hypothetical protein
MNYLVSVLLVLPNCLVAITQFILNPFWKLFVGRKVSKLFVESLLLGIAISSLINLSIDPIIFPLLEATMLNIPPMTWLIECPGEIRIIAWFYFTICFTRLIYKTARKRAVI